MTATRVNAILDIGIALALGVIGGAVAALAMRGCESAACQIVGDCAEPPTIRNSLVGGCGESRWQGEPTLDGRDESLPVEGNGYSRMAYGPVRTPPLESGQPPISSESNRTGRAADKRSPNVPSARRLPRGADEKLAQARLVCFRVTAYCPCGKCCGKWADGVTASSTRADHPLVAAPPEFPFGTVMTIPGYGTVRVEDRGGAIRGDRLDVFFPTHEEALVWGVRWLDVEIGQ